MSTSAKTRRRPTDLSGGFPGSMSDRTDQFMKFLETNSEDAFTRQWHRLERGMRLNRLRRFVDDETERFNLTESEKTALFALLVKALDKKQLNTKSIVNYDTDQQKILEIKGLVSHRQADGNVMYQLNERKVSGTMKKRAASAEPKSIAQNTS
jgi:hypothetical protein